MHPVELCLQHMYGMKSTLSPCLYKCSVANDNILIGSLYTLRKSTCCTSYWTYWNLGPYSEEVTTDRGVEKDYVNSAPTLQPDWVTCGWQWFAGIWTATSKMSLCNYINCCLRRENMERGYHLSPSSELHTALHIVIHVYTTAVTAWQKLTHVNCCIKTFPI